LLILPGTGFKLPQNILCNVSHIRQPSSHIRPTVHNSPRRIIVESVAIQL
jgi:hypothetical protein